MLPITDAWDPIVYICLHENQENQRNPCRYIYQSHGSYGVIVVRSLVVTRLHEELPPFSGMVSRITATSSAGFLKDKQYG